MDEWIIMNMRTQNIKLNEFINYLKRALNKNFDEITSKGREFDYNKRYVKNKKLVLPIYKNLYPNKIINLNKQFAKGDNFQNNLIKIQNLNHIQQYIYNINDLILVYKSIKEFGLQTCEYFVKYEIVKELFMNYVINIKDYCYFYEDIFKNNKLNNNIPRNMNGVCKKMKFYSYKKIDDFIKIFSIYDNQYININELFTTLIIIGSELITSENFEKSIMEFIPEEKRNKKNILLTKEEFMKIPFWFEEDRYLNELSDLSEENIFIGEYYHNYSINQICLPDYNKKNFDKNENESGLLSSTIKENINNNNHNTVQRHRKPVPGRLRVPYRHAGPHPPLLHHHAPDRTLLSQIQEQQAVCGNHELAQALRSGTHWSRRHHSHYKNHLDGQYA